MYPSIFINTMTTRTLLLPFFVASVLTLVSAQSSCPPLLPTEFPAKRNLSDIQFVGSHERRLVFSDNDTLLSSADTDESGSNDTASKIIGGIPSTGALNHYIVQLFSHGTFLCAASVLNEKFVLSAAGCEPPSSSGLIAWFWSASDAKWMHSRPIDRILPHPQFTQSNGTRNDVMLLRLRDRAPASASFVTVNTRGVLPHENAIARAAGFGVTREGGVSRLRLGQVDVPCRGQASCASFDRMYDHGVQLCAGYKCGGCDTCFSDAGGPIFQFDTEGHLYQLGIVSYGAGCGRPNQPSVYSRVSVYSGWIKKTIEETGMYVGGIVPQKTVWELSCPK